ncbi:thioredoxin family protein [Oligoflexus tunisiensis]|uniref:thioredoxin family protein n=1 Tax=Oligoflexus tunisiensis TaxID=708132 RepID=UPI00114CF0D1|nr:thioredoxin family protein [Oligoflexus tunisiensis]
MKNVLLFFCLAGCASTSTETIPVSAYKPGSLPGRPTIYMFSADQCEACREAKPFLEHEAQRRGGRVVIVDADDDRIMRRLGYGSLPVFRFVKPGAPDLVLRGWDKERFVRAYDYFDDKKVKAR